MKKRTLEIDEDVDFQRKEWLGQRVGMTLLFLFVFGSLLGLTGMGGPLSHGEAGEREGVIHVEYERVVRRGAPATLTIHLRTQTEGSAQFWISAPYFERVKVESITPQPESVAVEEGRHVFTIRSVSPEMTVSLEVEHIAIGRVHVETGAIGGPSVRFSQVALF
jgi:hypothetical protein